MSYSKFAERKLEEWGGIREYMKPGWIYRGQRVADWPLKTSLERCLNSHGVPWNRALEVEEELRREFRRTYHHYSPHVPRPTDTIEWLSLMQHHGAPTRLLDFTYSIYVASYFAIESANQDYDAAVWAVNGKWALRESTKLLKAAKKGKHNAKKLRHRFTEKSEHIMHDLFFKQPLVYLACPINPFRLNERLRIQKGIFLIAGTVYTTFEDNLKALPQNEGQDNILKIIIPKSCFGDALEDLFRMNISRASLFPGLDGFAQSLGVYHPILKQGNMIGNVTG